MSQLDPVLATSSRSPAPAPRDVIENVASPAPAEPPSPKPRKKWADVAADPRFQALSSGDQEAARSQYFDEVVRPQLREDEIPTARAQFDASTHSGRLSGLAHDAKRTLDKAADAAGPVIDAGLKQAGRLGSQALDSLSHLPAPPPVRRLTPESLGGRSPSAMGAGALPREARALLDTIAGTESPGYNIIYGGRSFDNGFADHPRIDVPIERGPNAGKTSSAAGRYQFIKGTWDEQAKKLGLKDFSPASQDAAAWNYAQETYRKKTRRDLLQDLRSGDPDVQARIGQALHGAWTSLPGGIEATTNNGKFSRAFEQALAQGPSNDLPEELRAVGVKPSYVDTVRAQWDAASPAERARMIAANDVQGRVARHVKAQYDQADSVLGLRSELAGIGTRREDREAAYLGQGFERPVAQRLADEDLSRGRPTRALMEQPRISLMDQVGQDWERGVLNTKAMGAGLGAWAMDVMGQEDKARGLLKDYQDLTQEATQFAPVIGDFSNIGEGGLAQVPEDVSRYLTEAVVGNLPNFLPSLAMGAVGGMVARRAAQGIVNELVGKLVGKLGAAKAAEFVASKAAAGAQGFSKIGATAEAIKAQSAAQLAQQGLSAALRDQAAKTAMGAAAGAGAASMGMETGSIYGDIYDQTGQMRPGVAGVAGVVAGALDAIPAMRAATKLIGPAAAGQVAGTVMQRLGKEAGVQFLSESGTEFLQTLIESGAVHAVDGQPLVSQKDVHEALNAALQGGIAGGVTGVATQGLSETRKAMVPSQSAMVGSALQDAVDKAKIQFWDADTQTDLSDDGVARLRMDPSRVGDPRQSPAFLAARGVKPAPAADSEPNNLPAWSAQLPQESGREQPQPVRPGVTGAAGSADRADGGADLSAFVPDIRDGGERYGDPRGDAAGQPPAEPDIDQNVAGLSERQSGPSGTPEPAEGDPANLDQPAADVTQAATRLTDSTPEKETAAKDWENLSPADREAWAARAGWGTKKGAVNAFGKKLAQKPWREIKPEQQEKLRGAFVPASDSTNHQNVESKALSNQEADVARAANVAAASPTQEVQPEASSISAVSPVPDNAQSAAKPPEADEAIAPVAMEGQPAEEVKPFDSAAWNKERDDRIKASKAAGNQHLDQLDRSVETLRGKPVYSAHDPQVTGIVRTVDNTGNVYVDWAEGYAAEQELASPSTEGKKTVYRTSLGPTDLKDYVVGQPPAQELPATAEESSVVEPQWVEHTTGKGKTLRGIVRKDITVQEAKQIDPFTFRKDGGFFIRDKHVLAERRDGIEIQSPQAITPDIAKAFRDWQASGEDLYSGTAGRRSYTMEDSAVHDGLVEFGTLSTQGNARAAGGQKQFQNRLFFRKSDLEQASAAKSGAETAASKPADTVKPAADDLIPDAGKMVESDQSEQKLDMAVRRDEYPLGRDIEQEDRFFGTRVRVVPELKGDTAWEGTIHTTLNRGRLFEVQKEGQDFTTRVRGERIEVLDKVDSAPAPSLDTQAQASPAITPDKPNPGRFGGLTNDFMATAAGQTAMANRAGRTALLTQLNEKVAAADPEAAYTQDEILNAADDRIDAMRDWLISKQPTPGESSAVESTGTNQPAVRDSLTTETSLTDPAEALAKQAQAAAKSFNPSRGVKGTRAQMREDFIRRYAQEQPEQARAIAQAWQADPGKYAEASGATPAQIRMFARVVEESVGLPVPINVSEMPATALEAATAPAASVMTMLETNEPAAETGTTTSETMPSTSDPETASPETEAAPKASAPAAAPRKRRVSQKGQVPASSIDDFGEKLEGSRKDYASKMQAAREIDIAAEPLSKSWPEPDYQKMLDSGVDPWAVGFVRALRDEIPTKPQKSWKLIGWVKQVKELRDVAMEMGDSEDATLAKMKQRVSENLQNIAGRIELYQAVGHSKSLKGITFKQHHYAFYRGQDNVSKWAVEQATKATAYSNWPREIAVADTKEAALAEFKRKFEGMELGGSTRGKPSFIIYRKRNQAGAFIGKKIGREVIDLHRAEDVTAAREYMANNLQSLEDRLKRYKETPYERSEENAPRVGGDHRLGAPVTPEVFADTFGFRGVQFGNYVEQDRRQSDLNEAFDALMDMAGVLGIPPKAISLNGRLGLAFGARGKGGINAASAHYEPDTVVINLTKGGGPGSLAHEWWHALDNYFAKEGGSGGFMTASSRGEQLRMEMRDAFNAIRRTIQQSGLKTRSSDLDKRRSKPYWTMDEELSARTFESYIIAKLQDQNAANDYLANVVSQKTWDAIEGQRDFGDGELSSSYPYPTADEMPAVRAAFDEFFKTVQTRETDQGVAMFSRAERDAADEANALAPLSADQSAAERLNRGMVRYFNSRDWSHAYVQRDLPESLAEVAEAAEAAFGTEIIGITGTDQRFDQFNGINLGGRHYINLNANRGFVHITGHELLHQLKRDRPDLYRWFAGQARGHYKDFSAYQDKLNALLEPGEGRVNKADAEEELLGDFTGDALADPAFVEKLAKADPSRFRQLLNAVIKWLKAIGEKLTGKGLGSSEYFNDVEALREHLANALVAYAQGGPVAVGKMRGPKFSSAGSTGPTEAQLQKEYEDTKARYINTPQWLKAPNGQPSNLNERQWVMVRTPRFKLWFGDWEAAAPLRSAATFDEAKSAASAFVGKPIINLPTGLSAQVSNGNLSKMTSDSASRKSLNGALHARAIANLDRLFANAVESGSHADTRGEPTIKEIRRFVVPMSTADGEIAAVKMLVKETTSDRNPNPLYTVEVVEVNRPAREAPQSGIERAPDDRNAPLAGLKRSFDALVGLVKGEQSSKVVDENGEPLVVYHGSDEKRNSFDGQHGAYFAAEKDRAKNYAAARTGFTGDGKITEVFLSLRNPEVLNGDVDADFLKFTDTREPNAELAGRGFDGQILKFDGDEQSNDFRVNQSSQVKDIGNTGAFSAESDDIRFSRRRPEPQPPEKPPIEPPPEFTGNPEDLFSGIDQAMTGGRGMKEYWDKAEDGFNELSAKTRRQVLGLMTVQQLVEQGSKVLPRMTDYLNEMTRMDATRGRIVHEADGIVKDWRKLDKPTLNRLAFVMHESTIAGVDGAVPFTPSIDVQDAEKRIKALYGFQRGAGGDKQIAKWQQEIRDIKAQIGFEAQRRDDYGRIKAMYDALPLEAQAVYVKARDFHVDQSKRVEEALVAMIEKSDMTATRRAKTIAQLKKDFETQRVQAPYFPLARQGDYWVSVAAEINDDDVVTQPAEFHVFKTYEQQAAFYDERAAEGRQVAKGKKMENLQEVQGVSAGFVADTLDVIGQLGESNPAVEDIRDQVYQLYLKTLPELSSRKHAIHRKKTKGFGTDALRAFADKASHDAYAYARIKHGFELRTVMEALGEDLKTAGSAHQQSQMEERKAQLEEFRDDVLNAAMGYQAVKERASSLDLQVQEIRAGARKRRLTEGENFVIEEAKKWGQFHRWMKNWTQRGDGPNWVNQQLKEIEQRADTTRRVAEQERGSEVAYDVYNELQQAYKHLMSPSTGRVAVALNSVGYLWHLAASPAAWITNALQTPTITMPYVSAKFGTGPTTKAFATAFGESLRDAGKRDTGKEHRFGILEALTRQDEIAAYKEALDRGLIERGRVMDLMGTAEEGASRSEAQRRWAMAMTFGFHDAERLNREVSFMASYRLARDAGQSFNEAVDYAGKVVNDTHFNYAAENRARFMRGDAMRAITQFKSYGQHVTYLQWRAVSEALGQDATPEQKKEARRFLLTQTAVQLAAAGVMGLPLNLWAGIAATKAGLAATQRYGLMGALGYTALVIGAAVGLASDDEDDPTDWEEELKQGLKEAFGDTGGEIVSKGFFNALIGIDLSSRLSQRELWWRDIDADIDDRQLPFEILSQLMGAGVGTGVQILEGLRLVTDGHTERGIEKMLPKATKDVLQAVRFADEGALTLKGDPLIEEFAPWEITAKAIGFTPSRLSQRYEENSANTTREKRIEERRQKLTGDLAQARIDGAMAMREGDEDKAAKAQTRFDEALANARRFNEKQPGMAIGGKTVDRSIRSRVRARAMARNGIFLNRKIPGRYNYATPTEDAE